MKEIYVNKPKPVRRQIGKALSKAANNISRADVVGIFAGRKTKPKPKQKNRGKQVIYIRVIDGKRKAKPHKKKAKQKSYWDQIL
jgi:hypothetical protein